MLRRYFPERVVNQVIEKTSKMDRKNKKLIKNAINDYISRTGNIYWLGLFLEDKCGKLFTDKQRKLLDKKSEENEERKRKRKAKSAERENEGNAQPEYSKVYIMHALENLEEEYNVTYHDSRFSEAGKERLKELSAEISKYKSMLRRGEYYEN